MSLSPGENPISYRDREIVRKLEPSLEKAIRLGFDKEAITIRESIEFHLQRAEAAEDQRNPILERLR